MEAHTVGTICLGLLGNSNRSYQWYSRHSGQVLHQSRFTTLPMSINVIYQIEYMAKKLGHTQKLTFHDRKMNVIEN